MMLEAKAIMDLMSEDDFDQAKARERLDAFNRISDEAHAKVADQEPGKSDWEGFERGAENFGAKARSGCSASARRSLTPISNDACLIRRRWRRVALPASSCRNTTR